MDWPAEAMPAPPILTAWSPDSIGLSLNLMANASLGLTATGGWGGANLCRFYPFRLYSPAVATQMLWWVGSSTAGNLDVGIYDAQSRLIVSSGSTAQSATTNTVQELNITDTELSPGDYLLAGTVNNISTTCFSINFNDELCQSSLMFLEQASAFPLPATAAPVHFTASDTPGLFAIGIQFASVF